METMIRGIRESQGMSRKALADRAGVTYTALTKWELGENEIGLDDAVRIAHALHCSLTELVGKDAPRRDTRFDELAGLYRSMSDDGKNALLATARGLREAYPGDSISSPALGGERIA